MPSVNIKLNDADIKMLQQKMERMGARFDEEVNKYMHTYKERFYRDILSNLPVSERHPRGGQHAKFNNKAIERRDLYLGFFNATKTVRKVENWREYGYLIFPEEGRGIKNKVAHRFFDKAIKRNEPIIFVGLKKVLQRVIKEQGL